MFIEPVKSNITVESGHIGTETLPSYCMTDGECEDLMKYDKHKINMREFNKKNIKIIINKKTNL